LEIRALVPIAKGSEIFLNTYKQIYSTRATRQGIFLQEYHFICRCEVCTLLDHLSDARDAKFELAADAADFITNVMDGKALLTSEADVRRVLEGLQTYYSFITQERTLDHMLPMLPIFLFNFLGLEKPL
jgi:hypothetical protein